MFLPLPFRRLGRGTLALALLLLIGCQPPPAPMAPTADEYSTQGITKFDQADYDGAIADYNRALALEPNDADVHFNLGLARNGKQDYAGAIAEFDQVLALNPGDAEACLSRGSAKFFQENYDGAIADYDHAIALEPNFTDAIYARALAHRREGNYDAAFADYDHAIALDPNYWRAYNGRATTHNAHGDYALAILDYEKRIALEPDGDEYAWFQRSLILRRLGRPDDGELAKQVASWPHNWPKTVGQFLLGQLGPDELLRLAALSTDPQTKREQLCEANYYVGITDLLAGRPAEAKVKFQTCVDAGVYQFLESLLARTELAKMQAAANAP
jgi:lipoprotein NlpI